MNLKLAEIIFWKNKVFIPSKKTFQCGIISSTEPVYIVDPLVEEITPKVRLILTSDEPILPNPSREEVMNQHNFLPKIIGTGSWKRLYKEAISYLIQLSDNGYLLMIPDKDTKKGWSYNRDTNYHFLGNTDLEIIVQKLLDEYSKYQIGD